MTMPVFWWQCDAGERTNAIQTAMDACDRWRQQKLATRYTLDWAYERDRLASNYGYSGALGLLSGGSSAPWALRHLESAENLSTPSPNIVKDAVDSVGAWTIAEQPPITVRSQGATFRDQYTIEELEIAIDGLFNTQSAAASMRTCGRDALVGGAGYAMPVYRQGKVEPMRLLEWQVYFDPYDARAGKPRAVLVEEYLDRAEIQHMLKTFKGITDRRGKMSKVRKMLPTSQRTNHRSIYDSELSAAKVDAMADQLRVVHGWRAASYPGRDDGRYVMMVAGAGGDWCAIIDMAYKYASIPVCVYRPMPSTEGIEGTSFGHIMVSWQSALDRSMFKMQKALDKYGHIRIILPPGATPATKAALAAANISLIEAATPGDKPIIFDPQVVRGEDIQNIQRILELSASTNGINAMMSRGASQLGANASGQALQEEHYRSLDRFSGLVKNWESFRVALADQMLLTLEQVVEFDSEFRADYEYLGRNASQPWSTLHRLRKRCNISLELRGSAALGRGGRTARMQEWASQGLIDPSLAKEGLLRSPDLYAAARTALAPIRLVEWQIRQVIEGPIEDAWDAMPDADTPLELAVMRATAMIQRAHVEGAEPETIERIREYKATAEQELAAKMPPPAPAAPMAQPVIPPMG